MSAYVVGDETINRILSGLLDKAFNGYPNGPKPTGLLAIENGQEARALGGMMYQVNVDSVLYRYDDDQSMIPDKPWSYQPSAPPTDAQLFKSIKCWLYQSCESEDTRNDPLYTALEEYASELAEHIVTRMPEYENAEWA